MKKFLSNVKFPSSLNGRDLCWYEISIELNVKEALEQFGDERSRYWSPVQRRPRQLLRTKTMSMIGMLVSNMVMKLMRNDYFECFWWHVQFRERLSDSGEREEKSESRSDQQVDTNIAKTTDHSRAHLWVSLSDSPDICRVVTREALRSGGWRRSWRPTRRSCGRPRRW